MLRLCAPAAALLVVICAALVVVAGSRGRGELAAYSAFDGIYLFDPANLRTIRLTSGGNKPTWSPNGETLAFMVFENFRPQLKLLDWETLVVRTVETGLSRLTAVVWSPDSTRLLLVDSEGAPFERRLYVLHIANGEIDKLQVFSGAFYGWTPDSTHLYFTDENAHTVILNPNTQRAAFSVPGRQPFWSSDARYIAYTRQDIVAQAWQIEVYDTLTHETRGNPASPDSVVLHGWSPDNRWLMAARFIPDASDLAVLYRIDPLTWDEQRLIEARVGCEVNWSPEGMLRFTDVRGGLNLMDIERGKIDFVSESSPACSGYSWRPQKEL